MTKIIAHIIKIKKDDNSDYYCYLSDNRRFNICDLLTGVFSIRFIGMAKIFHNRESAINYLKFIKKEKIKNFEIARGCKIMKLIVTD